MSRSVIDSSVVLALLKGEPISDDALDVLNGGFMSSVNVAEVFSKLSELGPSPAEAIEKITNLLGLLNEIVPFSRTQARTAGVLREPTRHLGLSLGDRSCLALAIQLDADVYTLDRAWSALPGGMPAVYVLRS